VFALKHGRRDQIARRQEGVTFFMTLLAAFRPSCIDITGQKKSSSLAGCGRTLCEDRGFSGAFVNIWAISTQRHEESHAFLSTERFDRVAMLEGKHTDA